MNLQSTGNGTLDIDEIGNAHARPPRLLHFIIRVFPVQNNTLLPQKSRKPEKSAVSSPARKKLPHSSYSRVRKSGGVLISSLELNSTWGSATSCEQFSFSDAAILLPEDKARAGTKTAESSYVRTKGVKDDKTSIHKVC